MYAPYIYEDDHSTDGCPDVCNADDDMLVLGEVSAKIDELKSLLAKADLNPCISNGLKQDLVRFDAWLDDGYDQEIGARADNLNLYFEVEREQAKAGFPQQAPTGYGIHAVTTAPEYFPNALGGFAP